MNFWSFSLQVYAKPGVAEACERMGPEMEADGQAVLLRQGHLGAQLVEAEAAQEVGPARGFAIDQQPVALAGD